jgi:hypothetical protein
MDITVKRQYCEEHSAPDHWVDENYHCHGKSLVEVEARGYSWARHIGGGWFRLKERYNFQQPFDLQPPDHTHVAEFELDF